MRALLVLGFTSAQDFQHWTGSVGEKRGGGFMSGRKCSWRVFSAAILVLVLVNGKASWGQNQEIAAGLSGTITDPTGLAVTGAKVTLRSTQNGIIRTYVTKEGGLFSFTLLPPAVYSLEVNVAGFKDYKQQGITLDAGRTFAQNVQLTVGSTTESVEVVAQASLINADNANISSDISAKQVEDLPLNLRNVISLAELNSSVSNTAEEQIVGAPGISGTADQDVSFLNFGGTFFNTAEYLIDGTWDTRVDWGGVIYVPSTDDVEEFKIQTNAFTAQYGWSSGNVINVVTKSGSNQIHGDAWMFYRNSAYDSKYFFNRVDPQPAFHRDQFGATIGGPIIKDKLYFFGYYEGLRQATPATFMGTMPTSLERGGNFGALLGAQARQVGTDYLGRPIFAGEIYNPFSTRQVTCGGVDSVTGDTVSNCPGSAKPGDVEFIRDPVSGNIATGTGVTNIIPAGLTDQIASSIATGKFWPTPQSSALFDNFTNASAAAAHSNEYSARIDYNFSNNDRVYGRWSQKYQSKINSPTYYGAADEGGPGVVAPNNRYSVNLNYNHIFSSTLAMNAGVGVNRHVEQSVTQSFGFKASTLGLPSFIDGIAPSFPLIQPQGYSPLGAQAGLDNYIVPQTLWTSSVDFTKVHGRHQLGFGFMDVWARIDGGHYANTVLQFQTTSTAGPDPQNATAGTGDGFAAFLLGVGSGNDSTGFNKFPATDKHMLGWYLQDDWKATRKLTLNLGLRYEIQTAPTERNNAQEYFNFTAANPISTAVGINYPGELVFNSSNNRALYNTSYKNFAPRIGAAYQLRDKLVWRGGYGLFFVPNYYNQGPNTGFSQGTPWVTSLNSGLNPFTTLSGNAALNCSNGGSSIPCQSAFPDGKVLPTGNSLGGLTDVGFGLNPVTDPVRHSPYVQQWMTGVQYAFTNNDLLDISYVGNHGVHVLSQYLEWDEMPASDLALGNALFNQVPNPFFNHITASGCGLDQPTVPMAQLLRRFPQYCSVTEAEPAAGNSNYNALQATYTHRWHSGLDMNVSYTYSRFRDDVQGSSGWAFPGSGSSVRNSYNLAAERSLDVTDTPHSLVANYNYELPIGRGKPVGASWSRLTNAILGGWQWSGILTAKSGLPLSINPATNNTGGFGFNQRPNLVPGVSPVPQDQSITHWINPDAFTNPAPFTFGDSPRFLSDIRAPKYFNWDMGIQKWWDVAESKRLQFRFEMFNALNHPNFFEPDTNLGDNQNFGNISAAYPARSVQFGAKFYW
jgi:Carboxypeptidase regulatory-like domain/TonB dependent receptor